MNEGWRGEEYLILFAESEIHAVSERYSISKFLPEFEVLGLRGWDDFIVRGKDRRTYLVPTVPCDSRYLTPYAFSDVASTLLADARVCGKIKWYTKPIAFGDPKDAQNLVWVDHRQHEQLVSWWNKRYLELRS